MITFLWWLSLALVIYFGSGIVTGLLKKNLKIAKWVFITFIISLVFCLTMF